MNEVKQKSHYAAAFKTDNSLIVILNFHVKVSR